MITRDSQDPPSRPAGQPETGLLDHDHAGGRSVRSDARRNRERVLGAARAIFAVDGADASMDEIARRAGVGLGTVYRHFPTKAALAAQLVAEGLDRFANHGHEAMSTEASAWDAFVRTVRRNLELAERDAGTRHAVAQVKGTTWQAVEPARSRLHEVYTRLILAAQAERSLRSDFDSEDLEVVMRGICASMDAEQPRSSWQRHFGYVLDGLRVRAETGPPSPLS